jgi:hypothetical protein
MGETPTGQPGVILRDFSPEEPALSGVEGILRASVQLWTSRICASRKMLRKLSMTSQIEKQELKPSHYR